MSSDDIAISVRNLGKTYRLFGHPGDRIKQFFSLGMKKYHNEFIALNDVSFDIKKGETVGIIGRNGSGKSTLLQLICGILKPTSGCVTVNGRVSALLELGAGFNPEFTGRENVYFQAAVMGMPKHVVDTKFDEVAGFADIGEFIDQPVRTYSSGMFVRLAFAVAVNVKPDVLVIDEALSVGDERFQRKVMTCVERMKDDGVTILLVSHSSSMIARVCEKSLFLDKGMLCDFSVVSTGIKKYHELLYSSQENLNSVSSRGKITHISARSESGLTSSVFETRESVVVTVDVAAYQEISCAQVGISITSTGGAVVFGTNTAMLDKNLSDLKAGSVSRICFQICLDLCEGGYFVSCAFASTDMSYGIEYIDRCPDALVLTITDKQRVATGVANLPVTIGISTKCE